MATSVSCRMALAVAEASIPRFAKRSGWSACQSRVQLQTRSPTSTEATVATGKPQWSAAPTPDPVFVTIVTAGHELRPTGCLKSASDAPPTKRPSTWILATATSGRPTSSLHQADCHCALWKKEPPEDVATRAFQLSGLLNASGPSVTVIVGPDVIRL